MCLPQGTSLVRLHCLDYISICIFFGNRMEKRYTRLFFLTFPSKILKCFMADVYLAVILIQTQLIFHLGDAFCLVIRN